MTNQYSLKQRLITILAELLGPILIRSLGLMCRFRVKGEHHFIDAQKNGGVILALWHGRMQLPLYYLRNRKIVVLISQSWDGELISRIAQRLGYALRRGSPRKGGRESFIDLLRDLRNGKTVAIFPDGPTGPRHSLHDGVIHLARMTGCPIVPFSFSAAPAWIAGSWDKHMIHKPFSKGLILFHEPITLPRRIDKEDIDMYRQNIVKHLNSVEIEADQIMGVDDVTT
jgi:lysophospholipid acyltransferase (LPLAT)-like uncharacterized protein